MKLEAERDPALAHIDPGSAALIERRLVEHIKFARDRGLTITDLARKSPRFDKKRLTRLQLLAFLKLLIARGVVKRTESSTYHWTGKAYSG